MKTLSKIFNGFLNWVEKIGNKLPDPFFIFSGLAILVVIISWIASSFGVSVEHPGTGEIIAADNLLDKEGIRRMLTEAVDNFTGFPPLGIVLVTIIGIGVADKSGFFAAALKHIVTFVPAALLTPTLIFAGVTSNIIADAGIVVLPPLGALLFASLGRHPIAGLSAAFAGVVGGFSANFFITALDPLLSGFTDPAAKMIDPAYDVYPTANYFFMIASVFLVVGIGTFVNNKIIEPRLGEWKNSGYVKDSELESLGKREKRALWVTYASIIIMMTLIVVMTIPQDGILRDTEGKIIPLFKSIVTLILLIFFISGLIYGIAAGTIKNSKQLATMLADSMSTMGAYIILAFAAGQFIAFFGWSNLGLITAVKGADFLKGIGFEGVPLLMSFFVFSTTMNIFIYSASGKWALFAPVFVPMFMLMGFSPETTQMIYRVGDSITNIITPLLPYFPIVIVFAKKFDPEMNFGRLLANLMPYSIAFFITWGIFLLIWLLLGMPPGPDAGMYYTP